MNSSSGFIMSPSLALISFRLSARRDPSFRMRLFLGRVIWLFCGVDDSDE